MEEIGRGFHSNIYRLNDKECVKKIYLGTQDIKNIVEMDILNRLEHPHICKSKNFYIDEMDNLCYVMDYYEETLEGIVRKGISRDKKTKLMYQLASAINFLHQNKCCHGDIRLSNIMIKDGDIMLIDFGLSKTIYQESIVNGKKEDFRKTDIFMLSFVFIFILTSEIILDMNCTYEEISKQINKSRKIIEDMEINEEYRGLIFNMSQCNLYSEEVLSHKIFNGEQPIQGKIKISSFLVDSKPKHSLCAGLNYLMNVCTNNGYPAFLLFSAVDLYYRIFNNMEREDYDMMKVAEVCLRLAIKIYYCDSVKIYGGKDHLRYSERECLIILGGRLIQENYWTVSSSMAQIIKAINFLLDYDLYCKTPSSIFLSENIDENMLKGADKMCDCYQLYLNYWNK